MQAEARLISHDPAWDSIGQAALILADQEPILGNLIHACVLNQSRLEDALS
jgi:hypothetical protein